MDKVLQNTETEFKQLSTKLETAYASQTQDVQKDFLNDLIAVREALYADLTNLSKNAGAIASEDAPQGDLSEENKRLKEENARLLYRVEILSRNFKEVLDNNKIKELQKENERLQYNISHLRNVVRNQVVNN